VKILSVASECVPFVKTGGLADVVGALPSALAGAGVEMRVMLPVYPALAKLAASGKTVLEDPDLMGGPARLIAAKASGLRLYLLEAPHLYDRSGGIYLNADGADRTDNPERFAALSWVAARVAADGVDGWSPDILHGHDWQAGFAPYYLKRIFGAAVPSVLTIHNVAFHGAAAPDRMRTLRLDPADFHPGGFEFWGAVNALKAGIVYADRLTTVSPTYARELMRPGFGAGLDGVLRARGAALSGILNGIDTGTWDPAADAAIPHPYKSPHGKTKNTAALRAEMNLPDSDGPLCVVVSRLTEQKGLDMLLAALPALTARGGQLALLGSGDLTLETAFQRAAAESPHVAVRIGYDEALSHRLVAGGDAMLVPSRFEPCGLTQLYALRYGTIPVVALTGGLADTVIHASSAALATGVATGLQFHPITAEALEQALIDLCALHAQPKTWARMMRNAMAQPVGWETSAAAYADLYTALTA
jgi:starch synthase